MVFNDLSVRVSAQTADFTSGINRAQDSLGDLSRQSFTTSSALQILQNRADEAGDEISGAGRDASSTATRLGILSGSASSAGAAFSTLTASTSGLSLSFGSLTTSLTGTLGLLGLVSAAAVGLASTLAPLAAIVGTVTAGLGALAAAFGTVIGTGILAFGERRGEQNQKRLEEIRARIDELERLEDSEKGLTAAQEEQLEALEEQADELEDQTGIMGGLESAIADLREELAPIITEFGEQFIPLIEDAIDAIPQLVRNIFDSIGGVDQFVRVIRRLGTTAFRVIPRLTGQIFDLARMALPVLMDFINFIGNNAQSAFGGMLQVTRELAPDFIRLGQALVRALPELTALGTVILQQVIPAATTLVSLIEDLIQMGQGSDSFVDFLDSLIQSGLEWLRGDGRTLIENAGNFVLSTVEDIIRPSGEGDDGGIVDAFIERISSVLTGVSNWLNAGGEQEITNLLTNLFSGINSILTDQSESFADEIFNPLQDILSSVFDSITAALQSEEANQLSVTLAELSRESFQFFADQLTAYAGSAAFRQDLSQLVGAIANSLPPIIRQAVLSSITQILTGPFLNSYFRGLREQFEENRNVLREEGPAAFFEEVGRDVNEQIGSPIETDPSEPAAFGGAPLVLRLEENTDLVEARIEAGAQNVVDQQNRRSGRVSGTTTRITR